MIRINQLKLTPDHTEKDINKAIKRTLRLRNETSFTYRIAKKSIDARKKPDICLIYAIDVQIEGFMIKDEEKLVKKIDNNNIMLTQNTLYEIPEAAETLPELKKPPVIIGMGPAGLFCGLMLARAGYRPILLERGEDVDTRIQDVVRFWEKGELNPSSNVQFGEGGAGTFSDGKLNTMIKDKTGRIAFVLRTLHEFGAKEEITYMNKPHIGTDVLHLVVKNIRNEILRLGGKVYFRQEVTDILSQEGRLTGLIINGTKRLDCELAVLAIGHSARDTLEMLHNRGIIMQPKAFAVGVRVEHPQQMIQENAYGDTPYDLPSADYKVTHQTKDRGVYSFCMCPGGYVVNASSEPGHTCVNGMSYAARDSKNANSAIVVTVTPQDYKGEGPLAGMYFQRELEKSAFSEGDGKIPVQTYGDFIQNRMTTAFGEIKPVTKGETHFANLRRILPEYICECIIEGMEGFAHNQKGFNRKDAILSAVESRTSSPVRILRDDALMSSLAGLMPCGEGAGYAGGITSAAIDGIRVYEAICRQYKGVENE